MPPLDSRVIVLRLSSRNRKVAALSIFSLSCSALAIAILRIAIAATLGGSDQPWMVGAALSCDPFNAALHHRLGILRFYSSAPEAFSSGLANLRRAAELNPNEALYWSDLASACESSGDTACADHALQRALTLSPLTPRLYWKAGNYYVQSARSQEALPFFHRLLDLDRSYAAPVFQVCVRALGSPREAAEGLLSHENHPEIDLAFADFMSARGDDDLAFAAWNRFASGRKMLAAAPLTSADSLVLASYLDRLIMRRRDDEARAVWAGARNLHLITTLGENGRQVPDAAQANLVFNPGFESPPLNWGFDWRFQALPFVDSGRSGTRVHDGVRCWRLAFNTPVNDEYEPVWQVVPVRPDQPYVLSAFVRSESLTSDSGPRLRVVDPYCDQCTTMTTEATLGTTSWHRIQASFVTASKTRFIKISLWRPRSRSFPPDIQGQFWLDDVSLTAADSTQQAELSGSALRPLVRVAALH